MTVSALVHYDFPAETGAPGWETFSPFVLECERALKLSGLSYERCVVDMMKIKALNPKGQLPVLTVGDEHIADSTAILQRIEALSGGKLTTGLAGKDLAEAWLWEEFSDTALYPYVVATRWADDRGWPVPREKFFGSMPPVVKQFVSSMVRRKSINALIGRDFLRGGLDACYARMEGVLDRLDVRAPESGFWMGASCTVADLGLFGQLHQLRLPLTPHAVEFVAKRKRLSAYLDRVDVATRGN